MKNYQEIDLIYRFLKRVKVKRFLVLSLIGIFLFLTSQAALILILGSVVKLFQIPWAGILFSFLSIVIGFFIVIKYLLLPLSSVNTKSCIFLLESNNKFLDNRIINSFQLSNPKYSYNFEFSQVFIGALVKETADILKDINLKGIIPFKTLKKDIFQCLFIFLLIIFTNYFLPGHFKGAISTLFDPIGYFQSFKKVNVQNKQGIAYSPKVGDIQLTYLYPSYTGLPTKVIKGSSGDINVLKGTEVIVDARVSEGIKSAVLNINNNISVPMEIYNNISIKGKMVVLDNGIYSIGIKDNNGLSNPDPIKHNLIIKEDMSPEIEIFFPDDMIEVKMIDQLEVQYKYNDDFGVKKIVLVYQIEDRTGFSTKEGKQIFKMTGGRGGYERYLWNLALLPLKEGGGIRYHLEAYDNDMISGPKKGSSEERYIKIYDSEEGHNEVIFNQEKILEEMIFLLADKLESPKLKGIFHKVFEKEKLMDKHLTEIIQMIEELIVSLSNDYFSDPDTSFIYQKIKDRLLMINNEKRERILWFEKAFDFDSFIDSQTAAIIEEYRQKELEEIETDIIEMDRLIKKEKLNSLYKRENDFVDTQDSLLDLISNLSEMDKDDAMKKLKEMLKRMEKMFNEFAEKMMSLSKELPDEFINSDALKNMDDKKIKDIMAKIKEALKMGDLDKAAQLAEELASQMNTMMNDMMDSAEGLAGGDLANMEEINGAVDKANELLKREKDLLSNTEKIDEELYDKMEEIIKKRKENFKQKIMKLSRDLNGKLENIKKESISLDKIPQMVAKGEISSINSDIKSMQDFLDSKLSTSKSFSDNIVNKFKKFPDRVNGLNLSSLDKKNMNLFQGIKEGHEIADSISDEFKSFLKNRGKVDEEALKKMIKMGGQQKDIKKGTNGLKEKIDGMEGMSMFLGPEMFNQLKEALKNMGKAEGGLNGGDMASSLESERDAVANLSKAADGLKKFQKEAKQMMQGGRLSMRPYSSRGIGSGSMIRGKVDIPSNEEHKNPGTFREEILNAMQGGVPGKYKDVNKRYYKELLK